MANQNHRKQNKSEIVQIYCMDNMKKYLQETDFINRYEEFLRVVIHRLHIICKLSNITSKFMKLDC